MFKKVFSVLICFLIAGCSLNKTPVLWRDEKTTGQSEAEKAPTVAVLLPLSGESEKVGASMKNAMLLKAFEQPNTPLKVLLFDTQSSDSGAVDAYRWALAQKPDIVVGPVFSKEVKAIKEAGVSVPLLTFTSDTTLVDSKVGTMAVTISEQVRQIVRNACQGNRLRLGVLAPDSKTGEIAMNALSEEVKSCPGMTLKKVSVYDANTMNFTQAVEKIAPPLINGKKKNLTDAERAELSRSTSERAGLDAIVLFEEGIKLRQLLSLLAFYDASPKDIPVYGLTLAKQVTDTNANYIYFADLDETGYYDFARQYKAEFGESPIRIATQMYDAIGFILSETALGHSVELDALQAQESYQGIDGLVRLNSDGTNKRALQLKQKRGSRDILITPAESFSQEQLLSGSNPFMGQATESIDSTSVSLGAWE